MKALFIVPPERFRDEECATPKKILEDACIEVTVAGLEMKEARGVRGMTIKPDVLLSGADASEYDALVIPGGGGSKTYLWENPLVLDAVKKAYSSGKIVAAICLSGAVLALADILDGKNATVFSTEETLRIFRENGAVYQNKGVVVDGKIITAQGPEDAEEFGRAILAALKS